MHILKKNNSGEKITKVRKNINQIKDENLFKSFTQKKTKDSRENNISLNSITVADTRGFDPSDTKGFIITWLFSGLRLLLRGKAHPS